MAQVLTEFKSQLTERVPSQLQQLLEDSAMELTSEQLSEVADLLTEFADIFAENNFDLGEFDAIQHRIDPRDSPAVRQRMHRTPLV